MEAAATRAAEHYRSGRFFNPGVRDHGFLQAIKWMLGRRIGPWPKWITSEPGAPPPGSVPGDALRITFVNHATVLMQTQELNLLTDPVWSRRVSPVRFAGPMRHRDPGIRFEDLPRIDGVLISHNHYDHFDRPTLRRLAAEHDPAAFCPLGLAKPLRALGFGDVHELDWWHSAEWGGVRLHCVPAQHFSARGPFDRNRTLWCGWVMAGEAGNIYFAADTGFGEFFREVASRFAPLRFAMLPIGAYEPEWFMGPIHMTPEQAVEAWSLLGAPEAMAIHFGTFSLADDAERAPVDRLLAALPGRPDAERFWIPVEGEGRMIPQRDPAVIAAGSDH
ncbi:MAG TPA: MBL fold metallo-hydrolase [Acidobacteriaceae bacterium]|nr:MBL fold metallo-hydrolase [Acidobacteriaceae bacterium]